MTAPIPARSRLSLEALHDATRRGGCSCTRCVMLVRILQAILERDDAQRIACRRRRDFERSATALLDALPVGEERAS